MCEISRENASAGSKKLPVNDTVGTVLAHDITEIRPGEFKGRALRKGMSFGKKTYVISRGWERNISLSWISQMMRCMKMMQPMRLRTPSRGME